MAHYRKGSPNFVTVITWVITDACWGRPACQHACDIGSIEESIPGCRVFRRILTPRREKDIKIRNLLPLVYIGAKVPQSQGNQAVGQTRVGLLETGVDVSLGHNSIEIFLF